MLNVQFFATIIAQIIPHALKALGTCCIIMFCRKFNCLLYINDKQKIFLPLSNDKNILEQQEED